MSTRDPVLALLRLHLDDWTLARARTALRATRLQYRDQGSALSHGDLTRLVGRAVGLPPGHASRVGHVVDLIHFAVDLSDNIADEEGDRRVGRLYQDAYRNIPRATLIAMPTLALAASFAAMATCGGRVSHAQAKTVRALGLATHGQGLADEHPSRPRLVSGAIGALYALPLWLAVASVARQKTVERWGIALAHWSHLRAEGSSGEARYRRTLAAAWPQWGTFRDGPLSQSSILGAVSSPVA